VHRIRVSTNPLDTHDLVYPSASNHVRSSGSRNVTLWMQQVENMKFWEELIAYFPWYNTTIEKNAHQFFYCFLCIRCRRNFLPNRCLATIGLYSYRHTNWWQGFIKYAIETDWGVMIYIPSFIKIDSSIQKLVRRIRRHTDSIIIV
jgi:hypothetical protein